MATDVGQALPWAYSRPAATGVIRACAADFQVDELLGYPADGEGEHQLVQIEKTGLDTAFAAKLLAQFCAVSAREVSFAGRKDRHAVTRQWFSVRLAGKAPPDWHTFEHEAVRVLSATAHRRKLRRGALQGNRFDLRVTALRGESSDLEQRLQSIAAGGVPNYFGPQRYGRNGANLERARRWFESGRAPRGRDSRGFALSAARSYLFDKLLGQRVSDGSWNRPLPGERMMLDGSRSYFVAAQLDDAFYCRLQAGDVHPSGPLWGCAAGESSGGAEYLERQLARDEEALCKGLENAGLKAERRALRVIPQDLQWQFEDQALSLQFALPAGCYATTVLRELVDVAPTTV